MFATEKGTMQSISTNKLNTCKCGHYPHEGACPVAVGFGDKQLKTRIMCDCGFEHTERGD